MLINKHHDKKVIVIESKNQHCSVLSVKNSKLKYIHKNFKAVSSKVKIFEPLKEHSKIYLSSKF